MNLSSLQRIKNLKEQNGRALAATLKQLGAAPFSERDLADCWLKILAEDESLYSKGWYDPPPDGAIALFGKKQDGYQRIGMSTFRPESMWPKKENVYEESDVLTVYTSPVCKHTNLIGDFGLSLYRGNDPEIWEHFENVLATSLEIISSVRSGMKFSEVYEQAMSHIAAKGYNNKIESSTDNTGTNIGHSIPFSDLSNKIILKTGQDFAYVRQSISAGRKFVNSSEEQKIQPNMAFTIEPRLSLSSMPRIFYHLTVVMEEGKPYACHGFAPVFEAFGMERLKRYLG